MGYTKKRTSASKAMNRPLKNVGPSNATMAISTGSNSATNGSICKITKAQPKKSTYSSPYLNDNDDDGDNDGGSIKSESTDDDSFGFENESTIDGGSDDEYTSSIDKSKGNNPKNKSKSKKDGDARDPNGRVKGRDLIPWTRPRMIEKLILHLQYEAELADIKLPWDAAVKRLHPGSKEGAAVQQLSKLRGILLTEGHMVPPKAKVKNKKGFEHDPQVRGYIRPDYSGPYDTRVVGWGEKIVDLSKNIENPGIYRGSGKYPRHKKGSAQSTAGSSQDEYSSHAYGPIDHELSRMVTLEISPRHLAKFPPGTGSGRETKNDQNARLRAGGDRITHNADAETGITAHKGPEDCGKKSEPENYSMSNENARLGAIKNECFDDQGNYEDMDVTVAVNRPIGGLLIHPHASQGNPYGNETMTSFGSAIGALASPAQLAMFSAFNSVNVGYGGNVEYGGGHQYNMYHDPSMLGYASYAPHETMSMGMVNSGQHSQGVVIPNQLYASYPYHVPTMGNALDASTGLAPAGLSSSEVTTASHRDNSGATDLKECLSNADKSTIVTNHVVTERHSFQSPPASNPMSQLPASSLWNDCIGDEESYDIGEYLNDDIFETTN